MSSRSRYFAFRTLQTILLIWLAMTFLFILFRSMPGSFADLMIFRGADPESVRAFEAKWGLNDPIWVQYLRYMQNMLTLNSGTSLQYRKPVFELVRLKIFNTFILVAPAITLTYILGAILGTIMGMNRGSNFEKYGIAPIIFVGAFPEFFLAMVMVIIFSAWLGLFPPAGMIPPLVSRELAGAPWWRPYLTGAFISHYTLPFLTVVLRFLFLPSLIMRTSVVEVLGEEFFQYHRITGLSQLARLKHVAKHASLPVITIYPISMTRAIGGLVLIETVFNWPGIGFALVEAVLFRDFPVVQFIFVIIAIYVIISNFVIDIIYGVIDPRVEVGT